MNNCITDFGAKPNGELCTKQIQDAIDACFMAGGGEVMVPGGRFVTGGLRLRSNVTLHLMEDAVLAGSINPDDYFSYLADELEPLAEDTQKKMVETAMQQAGGCASVYPCSRWNNAIIRGIHAKNIRIIGEKNAWIDGQNCYDTMGEEDYRGPHGINLWYCENVRLSGYGMKDCGNWAHAIQNSKNIHAEGITVLGGHDGFDMRTCDDVVVENCVFRSGDDAIAGFDNLRVTIRDCTLNTSCSALRFGGTHVLVENCTTTAPNTYGFRGTLSMEQKKARAKTDASCRHNCLNAFLYYCDYRAKVRETPGDIQIKNCKFLGVDSIFSQTFGSAWACNRALGDIRFEDCLFDGVCEPININCPARDPMTFQMKNCTIRAREGFGHMPVMEAMHFREILLEHVDILDFDSPRIVCCTEGILRLEDTTPMHIEVGGTPTRGGQ